MNTKRVFFLYRKDGKDVQDFVKGYYVESIEILKEFLEDKINLDLYAIEIPSTYYQAVKPA